MSRGILHDRFLWAALEFERACIAVELACVSFDAATFPDAATL